MVNNLLFYTSQMFSYFKKYHYHYNKYVFSKASFTLEGKLCMYTDEIRTARVNHEIEARM